MLQKYVLYARSRVFPKANDIDRDRIAKFYQEIRKIAAEKQGGTTMTVRHVESMVRIAEANARMELRSTVNKKDIDHAISVMLRSFCDTQRHGFQNELKKRFKHFTQVSWRIAWQLKLV